MSVILEFTKREKITDDILEKYAALIEKRGALQFKHDLILESDQDKKLFNGCHSALGELKAPVYRLLLSFHNSPSLETWSELKMQSIFGRTTALDIVTVFSPVYLKDDTAYPSIDFFMQCFDSIKAYTIECNEKYLKTYTNEIKNIESNHPSIVKIFN
jgi:hypothetical protein